MKKITLLFLLGLFSQSVFSQFEIGPRVGLSTVFTDIESTRDDLRSGDTQFGFGIGLFTRFGTRGFKVMPELLYTTSSTSISFTDSDGVDQLVNSDLDKIDVPIAIVLKPTGFFNIQGGIVGSYLITSDDGLVDNTDEAIRNYKDFTVGYQAGLGFEFGNFLLDLKYEDNLNSISNNTEFAGFEFDERQSQIKAMLGIKLF